MGAHVTCVYPGGGGVGREGPWAPVPTLDLHMHVSINHFEHLL